MSNTLVALQAVFDSVENRVRELSPKIEWTVHVTVNILNWAVTFTGKYQGYTASYIVPDFYFDSDPQYIAPLVVHYVAGHIGRQMLVEDYDD